MARTIADLAPEEVLASVLLADPDVRHQAEQARLAAGAGEQAARGPNRSD